MKVNMADDSAVRALALMPLVIRERISLGSSDNLPMFCCRLLALPFVEVAIWAGFSPSVVTTFSNVFFFGGLAALRGGYYHQAGCALAIGALLDFADGMVARRTGRCTLFGYRYDYVMDRFKSVGLFLTVGLMYDTTWVWGGTVVAVAIIAFREAITWLIPICRVIEADHLVQWQAVFGSSYKLAAVLMRNDPWQLVLFGVSIGLWPRLGWWMLGYYLLTLIVDTIVFVRSFLNFGRYKREGLSQLFIFGAEGKIKKRVLRRLRNIF